MASDDAGAGASGSSHTLDLSPEELAHLPPDELLQVCLEYRQMLLTIRRVLYTPNATLTLRLVAMDLVYRLAQHQTPDQVLGGEEQVVYIKQVSERLGLRPKAVRAAYGQLEKLGALDITDIRFPSKQGGP